MIENEISLNINDVIKKILPEKKREVLERIGTLVQNEAKKRCGVDTGILRNSITHVTDENSVTIGTNVEYAPYHHNNNPFLQSSIDENLANIKECFTNLL